MSIHSTLETAGRALFLGMLGVAMLTLCGMFALAAWRYPLRAALIAALGVGLYTLHRWREPSGDIDPREWPPD